jgi:hypothetical protein
VSDQDEKHSDLVEIAKRNGEFRKNYGPWLGALLYWLSIKATRPRSVWWSGLVIAGVTSAAALIQRYGWPPFFPGVAS